jgi:hypothetical protein
LGAEGKANGEHAPEANVAEHGDDDIVDMRCGLAAGAAQADEQHLAREPEDCHRGKDDGASDDEGVQGVILQDACELGDNVEGTGGGNRGGSSRGRGGLGEQEQWHRSDKRTSGVPASLGSEQKGGETVICGGLVGSR